MNVPLLREVRRSCLALYLAGSYNLISDLLPVGSAFGPPAGFCSITNSNHFCLLSKMFYDML